MSENAETHDWVVHVKGKDRPYPVRGVKEIEVDADTDIVRLKDGGGSPLGVFPHNAVAAIVRLDSDRDAT